MVIYKFKRRGPESRSVAGHLTIAVRLSTAPSKLHGGGGGGEMKPFCPDGYVWVQEAIEQGSSILVCAADQRALENAVADELAINSRPNGDLNALTPVEQLARALRPPPSISEGLRQQVVDLLTQTEHRLRNSLHQGVLTAYYFGGLSDQGRHAIAPEFWSTPEADGVLISGIYWPFGKPRSWHEERPSYPLCFLNHNWQHC